jgi:hypothetical protein
VANSAPGVDVLIGASGSDWYFGNRTGGLAVDLVLGQSVGEIIEELGTLAP